jgi:dethiobiotin synthetase
MKRTSDSARILFITGTGTGVGKTLLTGHLLHHLRKTGVLARAIKPFCSGGTWDVRFLNQIQGGELREEEITPFYFKEPIAPLVSERIHQKFIKLTQVLAHVRRLSVGCKILLIEGSGGLLVPLGEGYFVVDLVVRLGCEVIVVAPNKLGTINHTLLTVRHLQSLKGRRKKSITHLKVVLMGTAKSDDSSGSNGHVLREFLAPVPLFEVPFLGRNACSVTAVKKNRKKIANTLASILG